MAKSMRKGEFRPPQIRNRLIDFDKIRTLKLPPKDRPPGKILFRSNNVGGLSEYRVCGFHWKDNFRGSCFPR